MSDGPTPTPTPTGDIAKIEARLASLRAMVRSSVALRGGSILVLACLAAALLSLAVDRTFRLSVPARAVSLTFYAAAILAIGWKHVLRPLRQTLPVGVLAEFLEGRFPRFQDALRSAVDFARDRRVAADEDPASTRDRDADARVEVAMKRHVIGEAARLLDRSPVEGAIDSSRVATVLVGGVSGLAVAATLAVIFGVETRLWFARNVLLGSEEWPYRTVLDVEGFDGGTRARGVPRGDSLPIRVIARGDVPDRVRIRIRYERDSRRFNLTREGEAGFSHEHPEVTEPFEFTVEGGDYRSPPYVVLVLERPEVETLALTLEYPEYTAIQSRRLEGDVGEIAVPEGTRILLEGIATKTLEEAGLQAEGGTIPLLVSPDERRHFSGSFVPQSGGLVTIHLADEEGVPPDRWMRFLVAPTRDRIPTVAARSAGIGSMIAPEARIPLAIRASDDFGLTAVGVEYEVRAEEAEPARGELPFDAFAARTPVEIDTGLEVSPLEIPPGRRLDIKVYALDNDGFRGPKRGHSPTQSFLVVTPERLLEEFLRREEEQRRNLERAIEEQRGLRDAAYRHVGEEWAKDGPLDPDMVQEMVRMARAERQLARQMASISDAMALILLEMRNNRIVEANETERLAATIIGPLGDLAERRLPGAAARLGMLRELALPEDRTREGVALAADMEAILSAMTAIVQSMRRIEGYTEVVNRLRAIMRMHSESAREARELYLREIDRIFEEIPPEGG